MKGIDVSTHQKKIDWEKVKADGIEFAMLRAGYGNNNIDAYFIRNIKECNRLGILVGVYWFSYAYTVDMARREAKQCIEAIKPYKIDFPVSYDLEYGGVEYALKQGVKITKKMATDFAVVFCEEVEKAGYIPMNYANNDYMRNYYDMAKLKKYDLWYANPTGKLNKDRSKECAMWQYDWKGRVNGIIGDVDMNVSYKNYGNKEDKKEGDILLTRTLRHGDSGEDVKLVQEFLKNLGYYTGPIDGDFGPGTGFLNAVVAFQKAEKLENPNGNIGPITRNRIIEMMIQPKDDLQARVTKLEEELTRVKNLAREIIG